MVQTLSFQPSSGVNYRLGGKVLADGGSAVLEAGILISNSLGFNRTERRILANQSSVNSEFYVSVNDLTPGVTYYYKAFARNNIGETLEAGKNLKLQNKLHQIHGFLEQMILEMDGEVRIGLVDLENLMV